MGKSRKFSVTSEATRTPFEVFDTSVTGALVIKAGKVENFFVLPPMITYFQTEREILMRESKLRKAAKFFLFIPSIAVEQA